MKSKIIDLNKGLSNIAKNVNVLCPAANVQFLVGGHFVKRMTERSGRNFDKILTDVLNAVKENICLVIYYIHLDTALPERGKICGDCFEIRGNVKDGKYVLTTFIRK